MKRFIMSTAVAVLMGTSTCALFADNAGQNKGTGMSTQDQTFIDKAYQSNETELRLGQVAQDKATNGDVKTFATHMVEDHQKVSNEMKTLVSERQGTLPPGVDEKHKKMADKIAGLSGADFDKEYMSAMIRAHRNAVKLFEKEADDSTKTPTSMWAAKVLPTLKDHLQMAEMTGKAVGASADEPAK